MGKDEIWQLSYQARQRVWEKHIGPFPSDVQKLMNLTGVWPGGCLVQIADTVIEGLTVTSSFGLTNSDMPTGVAVSHSQSRGGQWEATLKAREPRPVPPGSAGYGYEIAVLSPRPDHWPLLFASWAVQAEVLNDVDMLRRVGDNGAITIEQIRVTPEGASSDFLITHAPGPLPTKFTLPNGSGRLLIGIAIHKKETAFALEHGQLALLERLVKSGVGPISELGRDPIV